MSVDEELKEFRHWDELLRNSVSKIILGQASAIDASTCALLAGGHLMLVGVPGTGKTRLAECLALGMGLQKGRIQFTPDLLPADILGAETLITGESGDRIEFRPGPIFRQLVVADEINRGTPRTQSALLEAMQERSVTIDGERHTLSPHFMVVATQNPIEQQGVYPLPEAQLDRFLFKLLVDYPSAEEETRIVAQYGERTGAPRPDDFGITAQVDAKGLDSARAVIGSVKLVDEVVDYIVRLIRATRESADLESGASPRAAIMLANAARARAAIAGRDYVVPDDVKMLARSVLRHRTILSPAAEIEGQQVDTIVGDMVERTEAPR